ncbi:MAG: ATP-binding protein [Oscillospiraceae bacterium]|nr:ATP-binding protein [Oscillospiraceae bacterium]
MKHDLPKTINKIASVLLSSQITEAKSFEESLWECLGFVGECVHADRVYVWRADLKEYTMFRTYSWELSKNDSYVRTYDKFELKQNVFGQAHRIFQHNKAICGEISELPVECQNFFGNPNVKQVKSGVAIPLFLSGNLWGLLTIEHLNNSPQPTYESGEIEALSSVSLMMANAIEHQEIHEKLAQECEKAQIQSHWYSSILDAIPMPISVTDNQMRWQFVNAALETSLGKTRDEVIGLHCSHWDKSICNTDKCVIKCIERGERTSYFTQNNFSFKIDADIIKDIHGEKAGYIEIVQDVTLVESMAKLSAEIEAANVAKSRFLASMSHEIRTPLNAILGIAQVQRNNSTNTTDAEEAFAQICDAGEMLLALVNGILDLSKIESGKLELHQDVYSTVALINDTAHFNYVQYELKPLEFKIDFSKDVPIELYGDEYRIKQIINNLLSNAFKYTEEGSVELLVRVEFPYGLRISSDAFLVILVRDTGQGMTESQARECFDGFTRFNAELNRGKEGTGLGMGITKSLVEVMGGEITVDSKYGVGSCFTVRIPQKISITDLCGKEISDKFKHLNFKTKRRDYETEIKQDYMPYGRILVVDDIQMNLQVAKGFMLPYGVQIDVASSGEEAIHKVKKLSKISEAYDIIFMDHMMPFMDGIEATKILRNSGYKEPIVALTANVIMGQKDLFLQNGFDGYVAKPIDSRELDALFIKFIRDKQPADVLEKSKKDKENSPNHKRGTFPILDMDEIKKYFVEDAKNAIAVFGEFIVCANPSNSENPPEITDAQFKNYTVSAHGMKSALLNVGEVELSKKAARLEKAGEFHRLETIIKGTPLLMGELERLIDSFATKKSKPSKPEEVEKENQQIKVLSGNYDSKEMLRANLTEIATACDNFNSSDALNALANAKRLELPDSIQEKLDKIDAKLLESDFEIAANVARKLQDILN